MKGDDCMVYIKYVEDGATTGMLYHGTYSQAARACFAAGVDAIGMLDFRIEGRTEADRRESLRDLARDFQCLDDGGLSWGEIAEIESFFRQAGGKYGLMDEFEENGIC